MLSFDTNVEFSFDGINYSLPITSFENHDVIFSKEMNLFAMATFIRHDLSKPSIIVGEHFVNLPEHAQLFILHHEIGHIINGDVVIPEGFLEKSGQENIDEINRTLSGRVNDTTIDIRELRADAYAAGRVGVEVAVDALRILKRIYAESLIHIMNSDEYDDATKAEIKIANTFTDKELGARINEIEWNSINAR
jgi:Zn-dependent protease with chaperone function